MQTQSQQHHYLQGVRSMSRLNAWSSDTLMAECYGKANVWLRGPGRSVRRRGLNAEPGIMEVDIVSRTSMAVGLSRDLVRVQEGFMRVHKLATAAASARTRFLARLVIDLSGASLGTDAASSWSRRLQFLANATTTGGAAAAAARGADANRTLGHAAAAASLGLTPQQTRPLASLLSGLDSSAAASAAAFQALDDFGAVVEAVWQRANISIGMCSDRWLARQQQEVAAGAIPAAATPDPRIVVTPGPNAQWRRGSLERSDDDDDYSAGEAGAADGDGGFPLHVSGAGNARVLPDGTVTGAGSPVSSSSRGLRPTDPTEILAHAGDALDAAERMVWHAVGGSASLAPTCRLRSGLIAALPSLETAVNGASLSSSSRPTPPPAPTAAPPAHRTSSGGGGSGAVLSAEEAGNAAAAFCASPLAHETAEEESGSDPCWPGVTVAGESGCVDAEDVNGGGGLPDNAAVIAAWWYAVSSVCAGGGAEPSDSGRIWREYCAAGPAVVRAAGSVPRVQTAEGGTAGSAGANEGCIGTNAIMSILSSIVPRLREAHKAQDAAVAGPGSGPAPRPTPPPRFTS
jgi:hypothetical protein